MRPWLRITLPNSSYEDVIDNAPESRGLVGIEDDLVEGEITPDEYEYWMYLERERWAEYYSSQGFGYLTW